MAIFRTNRMTPKEVVHIDSEATEQGLTIVFREVGGAQKLFTLSLLPHEAWQFFGTGSPQGTEPIN